MPQTVKLHDVYRELQEIRRHMVSKEELESFVETMEILRDPMTMKQLREAEDDYRHGRTKRVRSFKELLAELDA